MLSVWVMIQKGKVEHKSSPLTPELRETEESTLGSFLSVLCLLDL